MKCSSDVLFDLKYLLMIIDYCFNASIIFTFPFLLTAKDLQSSTVELLNHFFMQKIRKNICLASKFSDIFDSQFVYQKCNEISLFWDNFLKKFRCLRDQDVLQGAMSTLDDEVAPLDDPSEASVEYRKQLTKSLLYKVIHKNSYLLLQLLILFFSYI